MPLTFSNGQASEIIIPETREELITYLKENKNPVTLAGAGTGLTASRIPLSGVVISLERFNKIGSVIDGTIPGWSRSHFERSCKTI